MKRKPSASPSVNLVAALKAAGGAARAVGALMLRHRGTRKRANITTRYDIKLELDVRSQKLIERKLAAAFPQIAVLGEEGEAGAADAAYRWVIDPIDGTVNFAYDVPHSCISIALQRRAARPAAASYADGYDTVLGTVFDPFTGELWTAVQGGPARLNDRVIRVSRRAHLGDSLVSIGFAKTRESLEASLPYFNRLVRRVRKIRIMGAAALGLCYVASGRFDAYVERSVSLWDIAAGGFIIERAGGEFFRKAIGPHHLYAMIATNGRVRRQLKVPARWA